MQKNKRRKVGSRKFFVLLLFALSLLIISNINFFKIYNLNQDFYTDYSEIERVSEEKQFGNFISLSLKTNDIETSNKSEQNGTVLFKLFGFIPIRKVGVKIIPEEEVYLGGAPLGLSVNTDGAVVVSDIIINTNNNQIIKNKSLQNGDIIKKVNDTIISNVDDIEKALNENSQDSANVEIIRDNKIKTLNVGLLKDKSNKYKLGVWARNEISGIGTLTFVKKNGQYGALGHPVTNSNSNTILPITSGNIYDCNLIGVQKGQKNNPGELRGVFVHKNAKGSITKNTAYGIFGELSDNDGLIDANKSVEIGGRLSVKPGKAKLVSNISGIQEEYDIEIIKASYQAKSSDKSIVFRVVDDRLLSLTGGIVQGMSGSPIIQNNKLVGAVTHVFLSDPTKGYAVYSDWMLEQLGC